MSEVVENTAAAAKTAKEKLPKGMIIILIFSLALIASAIYSLIMNFALWNFVHSLGVEFIGIVAVDMIAITVSSVANLIGGTIGLIFCRKASRFEIIVIYGAIMMIFALYGILMDAVNDSSLSIVSIIFAIAFPLMYLIGGILNRQSAKK